MERDANGQYNFQVGPEHVGSNLLDIVSGALYSNVLDIVREYIQNSVDAGASRVRLVLRPKEIWVRDDGSGMTPEGLDQARKVAVSGKRGASVGFRGIGIYSSFAASHSLEVVTRPEGATEVFSLLLDFAGMRKEAEKRDEVQNQRPLPLQEAINRFTEIRVFRGDVPMDDGGSFTLVRISEPSAHLYESLEDVEELAEYLRQAVPLRFPPGHHVGTEVVKRLKAHGVDRHGIEVDLTPTGKDPMKKGSSKPIYMDDFEELLRPSVREIRAGDGELLGVLWFAVHRSPTVIPEHRHGIQIRIKGFGIGDVTIPQSEWAAAGSGVLYRHLIGELHIVHPALRPSSERANIEDSPRRRELMRRLRGVFKEINRWIQKRQTTLGRIVKRTESSRTTTNETLDGLCARYGAVPKLKRSEILSEEATNARKTPKGKGGGGEPRDEGGGGGGTQNGRGSGGTDTDGPPPKLSKMLMDLNIDWRPQPQAGKVFGALDGAVQDLEEPVREEYLSLVRERLAKLAF